MNDHSTGTLVLHVNSSSLVRPTCTIDGDAVPLPQAVTAVPVYAGRRRVEFTAVSGFTMLAEAGIVVDIGPGATVDVYYALPRTILSRAAIGFTPQERRWAIDWRGLLWPLGAFAAVLVLITLIVAGQMAVEALF